jgi:hypothetical protein
MYPVIGALETDMMTSWKTTSRHKGGGGEN